MLGEGFTDLVPLAVPGAGFIELVPLAVLGADFGAFFLESAPLVVLSEGFEEPDAVGWPCRERDKEDFEVIRLVESFVVKSSRPPPPAPWPVSPRPRDAEERSEVDVDVLENFVGWLSKGLDTLCLLVAAIASD